MGAASIQHRFTFGLRQGMHARPASTLAAALRDFRAIVELVHEGSGARADARSVLSVIGLDIHHGDSVLIVATGDDAEAALGALRQIIDGGLCEIDAAPGAVVEASAKPATAPLPAGLRHLGVRFVGGRGVSGGAGEGIAVVVRNQSSSVGSSGGGVADEEQRAALQALDSLRTDLEARAAKEPAGLRRDLLGAHAAIASDPSLRARVAESIASGRSAAEAVEVAAAHFAERLGQAASHYVRERVLDVQDVCGQVRARLAGATAGVEAIRLERESVVFAKTLTPSQLMSMDARLLRGLVLGNVGATSHTVILARSMAVPTVIGVSDAPSKTAPGATVVVDGDGGFVVTEVSREARRYYASESRARERRRARLAPFVAPPAATRDGRRLEVGANVSSIAEVQTAVRQGAEGVGLFRTELLFLDRAAAPTEEEQFEVYSAAVRAAAGRSVIFRTLDIGGDKPAPYMRAEKEANPFMGRRGIRLYGAHADLIRSQLRAIVRASALGPVKIMAPMATTVEEARRFREQVREVHAELARASAAFDERMPVGVMVEVPALAMVVDQLCAEVDFISIGTNDLSQYAAAADRGNPAVAPLADPREPAFLRLLDLIVRGARTCGRWVGVCGEMAGDAKNLPLLVGLGVDEISVAPGSVLALKAALAKLDTGTCRAIWSGALTCRVTAEVESLVAQRTLSPGTTGVLDDDAVVFTSDAAGKPEAIKEAIDALYAAGRTDDPRVLEEVVWAREETYSTGLGHGFAIPHGRSAAVGEPSIALVRLRQGVDWESVDGEPVRLVVLLAVPDRDSDGDHLKILARLARRLMHAEFRESLLGAPDGPTLAATLRREISAE